MNGDERVELHSLLGLESSSNLADRSSLKKKENVLNDLESFSSFICCVNLTRFVFFLIFVVMGSSREPDRDTGVKGMPNARINHCETGITLIH